MIFFVSMRERFLTLCDVCHVDTDAFYASTLDSAMRIAR